jgi:hypothetical protein
MSNEIRLPEHWNWGHRDGAYGPHGGHCFIAEKHLTGEKHLAVSKDPPLSVVVAVLKRAGLVTTEGDTHFKVAGLRIDLANEKKKTREVEVQRDQARDGIAAILEGTGCPSLGVLQTFFDHYKTKAGVMGGVVEKLGPYLDKLPQEIALEIKAAIGMSPDPI